MTRSGSLIADSVVSLAAIVGLMVVIAHIRKGGPDREVGPRFTGVLGVAAFFMTVRLLFWLTGGEFLRFLTYATAAVIPLSALLLAEGLLRRHAPKWAKLAVGTGAIALGIAALWPGTTNHEAYIGALLAFQLAAFLLVAGLVVFRDRGSLLDAENRAIFRVSLSLMLILPFIASDFQLVEAVPVRLSGLAILATCWLSLSLSRPKLSHRLYLTVFGIFVGLAGCGVIALAFLLELRLPEALQAGAILLALMLTAAIVRDDLHAREEATHNAVLAGIGQADIPSLSAYLHDLARRGVLDNALILREDQLAEFDRAELVSAFGAAVVSAADLGADPSFDTLAQSQLRALFERYSATHLFKVSNEPFQLAAVRQPGFSGGEIDRDLASAFGLARLIAERDCLRAAPAPVKEATT